MRDKVRTIRTPIRVYLNRLRLQLVPVVAFGAALTLAVWLWGRHAGMPHSVGEVETVELEIAATTAGLLVPPPHGPWELFDRVQAGTVLARLDDGAVQADLAVVRAEADRLAKELAAEEARARRDLAEAKIDRVNHKRRLLAEARTVALEVERAQLDVLDRQTLIETSRVELARQQERYDALKKAYDRGVATSYRLADVELRRDVVQEQIKSAEVALAQARKDLQAARDRQAKTRSELQHADLGEPGDLDTFLGPFRAAVAVQQARVRQIEEQVRGLSLRAPIDGVISQILLRPGQSVQPGEPILAISTDRSQHVISYIREYQLIRPEVGMRVRVAIRGIPRRTVDGVIERVAPAVRSVPRHHLRDPKGREWGLPVRIALTESARLKPGELVDISFDPPE